MMGSAVLRQVKAPRHGHYMYLASAGATYSDSRLDSDLYVKVATNVDGDTELHIVVAVHEWGEEVVNFFRLRGTERGTQANVDGALLVGDLMSLTLMAMWPRRC